MLATCAWTFYLCAPARISFPLFTSSILFCAIRVQHGGTFVPGQARYADLNADGKADLILQGWDNTFWVSLSTGTGFTLPALWMDHGGSFVQGQAQYADVNNDGKADLIFRGMNYTFWVNLSTGNSFASPQLWLVF